MKPLDRAIKAAGGRAEFAKRLGLTRPATYHWRQVPEKYVLLVEKITSIPRHELRPDLYRGYNKAVIDLRHGDA